MSEAEIENRWQLFFVQDFVIVTVDRDRRGAADSLVPGVLRRSVVEHCPTVLRITPGSASVAHATDILNMRHPIPRVSRNSIIIMHRYYTKPTGIGVSYVNLCRLFISGRDLRLLRLLHSTHQRFPNHVSNDNTNHNVADIAIK